MRRAMAGPRDRHIFLRRVGGRRAAVGRDDRRVFVAIAERDAVGVVMAQDVRIEQLLLEGGAIARARLALGRDLGAGLQIAEA